MALPLQVLYGFDILTLTCGCDGLNQILTGLFWCSMEGVPPCNNKKETGQLTQ